MGFKLDMLFEIEDNRCTAEELRTDLVNFFNGKYPLDGGISCEISNMADAAQLIAYAHDLPSPANPQQAVRVSFRLKDGVVASVFCRCVGEMFSVGYTDKEAQAIIDMVQEVHL
jgi:hypothetical protein